MFIFNFNYITAASKRGDKKGKNKDDEPKETPQQTIVDQTLSENQVFISHVEENADIALEIAKSFQKNGYGTWYYERDSVPEQSYILKTSQAIERSQAVILIISPHSLGSHEVHTEVITAHEAGKHLFL